jgi:hypothetical protein
MYCMYTYLCAQTFVQCTNLEFNRTCADRIGSSLSYANVLPIPDDTLEVNGVGVTQT